MNSLPRSETGSSRLLIVSFWDAALYQNRTGLRFSHAFSIPDYFDARYKQGQSLRGLNGSDEFD